VSAGESHPALHPNNGYHLVAGDAGNEPADPGEGRHFVPVGWEEVDRGICPCGEVVRWEDSTERWVADRSLRVLILDEAQLDFLRLYIYPMDVGGSTKMDALRKAIDHQVGLSEPVDA